MRKFGHVENEETIWVPDFSKGDILNSGSLRANCLLTMFEEELDCHHISIALFADLKILVGYKEKCGSTFCVGVQ